MFYAADQTSSRDNKCKLDKVNFLYLHFYTLIFSLDFLHFINVTLKHYRDDAEFPQCRFKEMILSRNIRS